MIPDNNPIDLSVIIPLFNEAERIRPSLDKVLTYLASTGKSYEVVLVDDGSTDTTLEVISDVLQENTTTVQVLAYSPNRGKGYAVRSGMLRACGALRLFSDADLSTPIEEIENLSHWINKGYDVSIASRSVADSHILQHQPLHRELMGKVFNKIVRLSLALPFSDTQCGFKCIRGPVVEALFPLLRVDGFGFDVELLYVAKYLGYSIREVGAKWHNSPTCKVSLFGDPIRMLGTIPKIYRHSLMGHYRMAPPRP